MDELKTRALANASSSSAVMSGTLSRAAAVVSASRDTAAAHVEYALSSGAFAPLGTALLSSAATFWVPVAATSPAATSVIATSLAAGSLMVHARAFPLVHVAMREMYIREQVVLPYPFLFCRFLPPVLLSFSFPPGTRPQSLSLSFLDAACTPHTSVSPLSPHKAENAFWASSSLCTSFSCVRVSLSLSLSLSFHSPVVSLMRHTERERRADGRGEEQLGCHHGRRHEGGMRVYADESGWRKKKKKKKKKHQGRRRGGG